MDLSDDEDTDRESENKDGSSDDSSDDSMSLPAGYVLFRFDPNSDNSRKANKDTKNESQWEKHSDANGKVLDNEIRHCKYPKRIMLKRDPNPEPYCTKNAFDLFQALSLDRTCNYEKPKRANTETRTALTGQRPEAGVLARDEEEGDERERGCSRILFSDPILSEIVRSCCSFLPQWHLLHYSQLTNRCRFSDFQSVLSLEVCLKSAKLEPTGNHHWLAIFRRCV